MRTHNQLSIERVGFHRECNEEEGLRPGDCFLYRDRIVMFIRCEKHKFDHRSARRDSPDMSAWRRYDLVDMTQKEVITLYNKEFAEHPVVANLQWWPARAAEETK